MTSEPDSTPGRRPPTIELEATEIERPEAAAQPGEGSSAEAPSAKSSTPQPGAAAMTWLKSHAVGAGLGAGAMAVIFAALLAAGIVAPRGAAMRSPAAAPGRSAAMQSAPNNTAAISARLDELERAVKAQQTAPGENNGAAATEAQTKALSESVAALSRRLDEIAATSQSAVKTASAAQTAAEAAKAASEQAGQSVSQAARDAASKAASAAASNVASQVTSQVASQVANQVASQIASEAAPQKSQLDSLAGRVVALENAVKALSENAARPAEGANDQAARLTIAAEALRAALERGAPYQAELAAVQALGVTPDAIAPLQPFAATGVPATAALARALAALAPDLRRGSETASGGSNFLERLEAHARQLVRITPIDAPAGNAPSAVTARIEADAAHGDIAAALSDIAALPEPAKSRAADWVGKAKAREAAIAASRQIAAVALADLSKPAPQ
jgi:hypothetical protein